MKLSTVKAVKESCNLGLKEAKDMVDGAPSLIAEGVTYQEAQKLKDCIEKTDSKVEFYSQQMASWKLEELKNDAAEEWSNMGDDEFNKKNYRAALSYYLQAIGISKNYRDYSGACSRIAYLYYYGYGTDKNYDLSARYYRLAADCGYANAQLSLGILYQNGQGVPKNYAEAARWYEKAAQQGDETAKKYLNELRKR